MKLRFSRTDGRTDGHIGDIEALADARRALKNVLKYLAYADFMYFFLYSYFLLTHILWSLMILLNAKFVHATDFSQAQKAHKPRTKCSYYLHISQR